MPLLRLLLAVTLLAFNLPLHAGEPPKIDAVQRSLDTLAERKLAEPEQTAIQKTLEQTLRLHEALALSRWKHFTTACL